MAARSHAGKTGLSELRGDLSYSYRNTVGATLGVLTLRGSANANVCVTAPAKTVKGNKMPYGGLHNAAQLEDLIAYLQSLH